MTIKNAKTMETKGEKDPAFPAGFEQVQERLTETTDRVKQIDDHIKNIPKEQGPTIKYDPPYGTGRVIPGSRDKARLALQKQQHELKMDTLTQTEAITKNADGKVGRVVRDKVREALFPNPYRLISQEDRIDNRGALKDLEQSQDYMDAQLVERAAAREKDKQEQKQSPKTQNKEVSSMSDRFSQSLSYTKVTEKTNVSPASTRDRQPDKDRD